jgi:hypothetical protein
MAMMDALAKKAFWDLLEAVDPAAHERLSRPVVNADDATARWKRSNISDMA